jgi:hypothetical protein
MNPWGRPGCLRILSHAGPGAIDCERVRPSRQRSKSVGVSKKKGPIETDRAMEVLGEDA